MERSGTARQPQLLGQKKDKFWLTVGLCALTAALFFLPFYIIDGGFFHYAGDFNSQQISFYRYMNGFIKGAGYPDSAFTSVHNTFSWATDLGSGVMNAYSFYLYGSPFFWFSLLFPQGWLPYLMVPLLVFKFAVAGGGAYLYLRHYVKNIDYAVLGACLYTFSGFTVYNVFFNHFVDVVALFPYLLWSLDEALYNDRRSWFAFWVAVNLVNNYFFFIGQVVFLAIYFICKLSTRDFRLTAKKFGLLAFESLLGVAMGSILLVPAVLSILQNPRTIDLSSGWGFLTYSKVQQYLAILVSWIMPPDSPYLTSIWSEGVIKWTSMSAYLPLCSLAGAVAYWKAKCGDSKKRIVGTCAVFALVPILNSAFYALNSSYYARWYYMPVLVLCAATAMTLQKANLCETEYRRALGLVALCTLSSIAFALVPNEKDGTTTIGVVEEPLRYWGILLVSMLGAGLFWLLLHYRRQLAARFPAAVLAVVLGFSFVYGQVHLSITKYGQWYHDADYVQQTRREAPELNAVLPDDVFYRLDAYDSYNNLGLWLDKSCIQFFNSTVAPSILEFYPTVGVKRDVNSKPEASLYALRGLLSVRYTLVPKEKVEDWEKEKLEGWNLVSSTTSYLIYENENWVPMGFAFDYYVTADQLDRVNEDERAQILCRAVLLDDDQISAFGGILQPLPDEKLTNRREDAYTADCVARRDAGVAEFAATRTGFTARTNYATDELVFFSVPYDDGFTATVNGEPATIEKGDDGLMAVCVPAGENEIEFTYHTPGLKVSATVSTVAIVVYGVYLGILRKKKRGNKPYAKPC